MSVFLLALVGLAALETSLLSLGFVDVVSFSFCSFPSLTTPSSTFIYIFSFYSTYLASLT